MKTDYTREDLIAICERAIVPQDKWGDRDSESAQTGVGRAWQLLKCGCKYEVINDGSNCSTNDETIWIRFWVRSFLWFENAPEDREGEGYDVDSRGEDLHFYLPTVSKLEAANGNDWY